MSPFALSILGLESMSRRRQDEPAEVTVAEAAHGVREIRPARSSRRATSHYNSLQTVCAPSHDGPPAYAIASAYRPQKVCSAQGVLPKYTSTVNTEARMLFQLESTNPLNGIGESEWREVYVVICGTLLSFHRVKDGGAGKLLRSYTLQHAEVGLATDTDHTILIPQTRLAHLIPSSRRQRAWQKDPGLFRAVKQTVVRLRAETDQILLAHSSEEDVHGLICAISAAIDISCAIDERSIPRICTVPRRQRRRQRIPMNGDLNDPALLAEQERILRDMYPAFAERTVTQPELQRTTTSDSVGGLAMESTQTTLTREEDDLDLNVMREDLATPSEPAPQSGDVASHPGVTRQITASSLTSVLSGNMLYSTSPSNFNISGKWQPPHPRTAAQIQRYTRRCMPVLLAESVRASDVLISNGKRVKVNWRMELLEEWELSPPSYKAHGFKTTLAGLERSQSASSQSPSTAATDSISPQSSRSVVVAGNDQVEVVGSRLANMKLAEVNSAKEQGSPLPVIVERSQMDEKVVETTRLESEIHGVVFAF
ncbi:hypothetical protein LTR08_003852 [Meristemomyces frigidus]|nr:hypothetical protein LTR08_003852 [Meristemomyces frigidus]